MDVSQTILQDLFAMTMLADITGLKGEFGAFSDRLKTLGENMGLQIHVMHEDIFNSMHRI
jgi:ACT domain-containing protein